MNKPTHIWLFDANYRIYTNAAGQRTSAPIWREHWRKHEVIGETSRSWLIGNSSRPTKIPKNGSDPHCVAFSESEIDDAAYVNDRSCLQD